MDKKIFELFQKQINNCDVRGIAENLCKLNSPNKKIQRQTAAHLIKHIGSLATNLREEEQKAKSQGTLFIPNTAKVEEKYVRMLAIFLPSINKEQAEKMKECRHFQYACKLYLSYADDLRQPTRDFSGQKIARL